MTKQEGVWVADSGIEFGRGTWRARGVRAYNGSLGAEPPAGSRGRAPGGGSGGRSPLKLKAFELLSIQWKRQNALFSLLCNHNKLGCLRSEPKPNVPLLGWRSRGTLPPEAESIFDLGIGTSNGSCKFRALGACAPSLPPTPLDPPLVQGHSPGRGVVTKSPRS